jgi:hypothetical protein
MAMNRRDFVKGGVALVSIGTTAGSFLKGAVAFAAQHPGDVIPEMGGKTLILVQMAGGTTGFRRWRRTRTGHTSRGGRRLR